MNAQRIRWPEFFARLERQNQAIDAAFMNGTLRDKIRELNRNEHERIARENQEPSSEEGAGLSDSG